MAKLIKQIHDLIELATDKGITNYHSPSQIDDAVHAAQMVLFRTLNERVRNDKSVRSLLLPFEKRASITIASKIGTIPADFIYEVETWSVDGNGVSQPIHVKEETTFRRRRRTAGDPIDTMSDRVNTAIIYNDTVKKIELEQNVTPVLIRYYRLPVKPIYATTDVSGQLVYSDGSSTDVEWSDAAHDLLLNIPILGVNLRDLQVQRFGNEQSPKVANAL